MTIIDAGVPGYYGELPAELAAMGRSLGDVKALVLTHGHSDHIGFAERTAKGAQRSRQRPRGGRRPRPRRGPQSGQGPRPDTDPAAHRVPVVHDAQGRAPDPAPRRGLDVRRRGHPRRAGRPAGDPRAGSHARQRRAPRREPERPIHRGCPRDLRRDDRRLWAAGRPVHRRPRRRPSRRSPGSRASRRHSSCPATASPGPAGWPRPCGSSARPQAAASHDPGVGAPSAEQAFAEPAELHDVVEALATLVVVELVLLDLLRTAVPVERRVDR